MNSQNSINTGYIFQNLWHEFKKYDRNFLLTVVKIAFESLLFSKKIYTIHYDGNNGEYLNQWGHQFSHLLPNFFLASNWLKS